MSRKRIRYHKANSGATEHSFLCYCYNLQPFKVWFDEMGRGVCPNCQSVYQVDESGQVHIIDTEEETEVDVVDFMAGQHRAEDVFSRQNPAFMDVETQDLDVRKLID